MSTLNRRTSVIFTPPASPVTQAIEDAQQTDKFDDPPDHVTLFGHMTTDTELIGDIIRRLPYAGADYRSNLRIARGACKRLASRCTKLLGDEE